MQHSPGQQVFQSQLYSSDGVLRNADVITQEENVFGVGFPMTGIMSEEEMGVLKNPDSSGVILLVDSIVLRSSVNTIGWIYYGPITIDIPADPGPFNFSLGGAASVAEAGEAIDEGTGGLVKMLDIPLTANVDREVKFDFPILIPENTALIYYPEALEGSFYMQAFWREF